MGNAELRAAAERLVEYWRQANELMPVFDSPPLEESDSLKVATAYLASHPADEDEPVTADWLRSVGFETAGNPRFVIKRSGRLALASRITENWVVVDTNTDDYWLEIAVPSPSTRGQVRRLCAALGIPLTEAKP